MGKAPRAFLAQRVYQTAEWRIRANVTSPRVPGSKFVPAPAAWVEAVRLIPPAEILTRTYPVQHTPPKEIRRGGRVAPGLYRPTRIVHPEDRLRQEFFRDHPWELARPRLVLELDGQDARDRDWSKGLVQPGMALSGESVVQRWLWLMEAKGLPKKQAYDVARKEFYKLRQQEEIERRVAVEEARMYGGYFGMSDLQVGMQLEDETYESWKKWAAEEIAKRDAEHDSLYSSPVDTEAAEDIDVEEVAAAV